MSWKTWTTWPPTSNATSPLTPIRRDEFTERGFKSILYQIGDTLVDFFEPLRDDTPMAQQLQATGPGVMHVAWGVDGIGQLFNDLQANGNDMRGDGPSTSPFGYLTASIEPASSHGIYFQLAEGRAQLARVDIYPSFRRKPESTVPSKCNPPELTAFGLSGFRLKARPVLDTGAGMTVMKS